MTLTLITGLQNDGKTLIGSKKCFEDWLNGRTIYSNTPLNIPHILFNKDFLIDMVKKGARLPNITWFIDEGWLWLDSRTRERILSYFYLQSSKDNANIIFTSQTARQIDIRLRENLHYLLECKRKIFWQNKFCDIPKDFRDRRTDLPDYIIYRLFIEVMTGIPDKYSTYFIQDKIEYIYAPAWFNLFNTTNKIALEV